MTPPEHTEEELHKLRHSSIQPTAGQEQSIQAEKVAISIEEQMAIFERKYQDIFLFAFDTEVKGRFYACTITPEPLSSSPLLHIKVRKQNVMGWEEVFPECEFDKMYRGVTRNGLRFRVYSGQDLDMMEAGTHPALLNHS